MKKWCHWLVNNRIFEIIIVAVILVNCVLIGVETYTITHWMRVVQAVILGIFTFEIAARFIAADNPKSFFSSGWNWFDLSLVLISFVPESLFANASTIMVLRVLRVFRVLRLLRTSGEIKLIISVLVKSFSALFYNGVFFFIFIYLFAIIGISIFRLPDPAKLDAGQQAMYEKLITEAPNAPEISPDPYGTLSEAMFTLFRALTGEDWTDLRYNLVKASEYKLVHVPGWIVTTFHVVWFILSAFLLLNLVVGAIVNNYQIIMEQSRAQQRPKEEYNPADPGGTDR